MKPKPLHVLLPFCVLLALVALAPTASAATGEPSGASNILFVQQTDGASLRHTHSGGFELRLTGVSPRVSTLADRPGLPAGSKSLRTLVSRWSQAGFTADPPRAALVPDHGGGSSDVTMLTLTHPRYDRRQGILSYRVKPLRERDLGALSAFVKRAGPVRSGSFGSASLVVANGGGEVGFETLTFTVNNATPGQPLTLRLSADGGRVAWDIPPVSRDSSGLQLIPELPGIPLTRLYGNSATVAVETAPGGPAFNYKLIATFEIEGSQSAYVSFDYGNYTGAPAPGVAVRFRTTHGEEAQEMVSGEILMLSSLQPM